MSLLNSINGRSVLSVGLLGATLSAYWLGLHSMVAIAALCAGAATLTYFGKVQSAVAAFFKNHLADFAEVPAWPRFVLLGIASLVAAHQGGLHGCVTLGFLLAAMDGNVFDALY